MMYFTAEKGERNIHVCSAHAEVKENKDEDKSSRQALRATRIEMEISYSRYEIKAIIKKLINQRWQQLWETEIKV